RLSPGISAIRTPHAVDEGGRRDRPRRQDADGGRAGDPRPTWWGFDTRERVLFPGDGFAYSHYHEDDHCGLVAEEAVSLDLPDVSSTFADLALFWTKFAEMNVYCDQLERLIERLAVKNIAPTHGLPVTDVKGTVPQVQEGLEAAGLSPESGANEKMPLTSGAVSMA